MMPIINHPDWAITSARPYKDIYSDRRSRNATCGSGFSRDSSAIALDINAIAMTQHVTHITKQVLCSTTQMRNAQLITANYAHDC